MTGEECFNLLAEPVQRWIYDNNWTSLRDIQKIAIEEIMSSDEDIIVSASTAQGKTEAVFLPIISKILEKGARNSLVLYVSPLTALIDDQFSRLSDMCQNLGIPVIPWHGSSSEGKKRKFLIESYGILIITPESLQSLFVNKGNLVGELFKNLSYIVVDELHSFIGTERGKQLQCLIHLSTLAAHKRVPRIGLSATIGDIKLAAEYLSGKGVKIIESNVRQPMKILQKYEPVIDDEDCSYYSLKIVDYLFPRIYNSKNLIFPNSKDWIELFAHYFQQKCEKENVENNFRTHYANISRRIKKDVEEDLKNSDQAINVICTNTLELGIDIGSVKSIVQINPPMTVSSLRQRMGRSGRHEGESAILRAFTLPSFTFPLADLSLCKMASMISLLIEGWCEPPIVDGLHLSTLIQQILSYIRQKDGTRTDVLYKVFCESGLFKNISNDEFHFLLNHLKEEEIIEINQTGLISLGREGEKITNHFHFYAAFKNEEEMFDLIDNERKLGEIPKNKSEATSRQVDDVLMFAGKKWRIIDIDFETKKIKVVPDPNGRLIYYDSTSGDLDTMIVQRMFDIYTTDVSLPFLDENARKKLNEDKMKIGRLITQNKPYYINNRIYLTTWKGTRINRTLKLISSNILGIKFNSIQIIDIGISLPLMDENEVQDLLIQVKHFSKESFICAIKELPRKCMEFEKWDYLLPDRLLWKNFESLYLDFEGLKELIKTKEW